MQPPFGWCVPHGAAVNHASDWTSEIRIIGGTVDGSRDAACVVDQIVDRNTGRKPRASSKMDPLFSCQYNALRRFVSLARVGGDRHGQTLDGVPTEARGIKEHGDPCEIADLADASPFVFSSAGTLV